MLSVELTMNAFSKEKRRSVSRAASSDLILKTQERVLDILQGRSRTEGQLGLGLRHHFFAGARVAHFARFTVLGVEGAEASELDGVAIFGGRNDGVDHSVDRFTSLGARDARLVGNGFGEFRLVHEGSPRNRYQASAATIAANGLYFDRAMKRDS
jgi:hypothetical protein